VIDVDPLPPATGDRTLIRQVFANLIGNAFKFTRGRPAPRIEVGARSAGGDMIYLVRDNGAGFDMRYADKLFQVFTRLHHADEFEGNGVGLALVQRIIQRHRGRVWAEGVPNQGATFYFTLPRETKSA
jgi:light-regulated signal transduction histidine kinase (bacteriophytochrome)